MTSYNIARDIWEWAISHDNPANNGRFKNQFIFFKNVCSKHFENVFKMFGKKSYVLKTSYKMFSKCFIENILE